MIWVCKVCTFLNASGRITCEICGASKPQVDNSVGEKQNEQIGLKKDDQSAKKRKRRGDDQRIEEISRLNKDEYNYANDEKIPDELKCKSCGRPFIDPVLHTSCGVTFCKTCLHPSQQCPSCRKSIHLQDIVQLVRPRDTLILNQLDSLLIRCTSRDCNWQGPRKLLVKHVDMSCNYLRCPQSALGCEVVGGRKALEEHKGQCMWDAVPCAYSGEGCEVEAPRNEIAAHEQSCLVHKQVMGNEGRERGEQQEALARQREEKQQAREEKMQRAEQRKEHARQMLNSTLIKLNVGGMSFQTTTETLLKVRDSLLHAMVSQFIENGKEKEEEEAASQRTLFLDRDPRAFDLLLNWLRTGSLPPSLTDNQKDLLQMEAKYFELRELQVLCGGSVDHEDELELPNDSHYRYSTRILPSQLATLKPPFKLQGAELRGQWLAGFDFKRADLRGCDLRGANLSSADLTGACLVGANLSWANLDEAVLHETDMTDTIMVGTRCRETKFNKATLTRVDLSKLGNGDTFNDAVLTSVQLPQDKSLDLTGCTLVNIDLRHYDLTDWILCHTDLRRATFDPAQLGRAKTIEEVNLVGMDISGWSMDGWDLTGANLFGARLPRNMKAVKIAQCDLRQTNLHEVDIPDDLSGSNLTDLDLSNKDFANFNLADAHLQGTILPSNLAGANLSRCDLSHRDLRSSNLTGTNLSKANLVLVKFPKILQAVNFSECNLEGRDFRDHEVRTCCFARCVLPPSTQFPQNMQGVNLSQAQVGCCLRNSDVQGANFSNATFLDTARLPSTLRQVDFTNCILPPHLPIQPNEPAVQLDLSGAILTKANLSKLLVGSRATLTSLAGTDLRTTILPPNLNGVDMTECNLEGKNLTDHSLQAAKFNKARLKSAHLSSNLSHAQFEGADMEGVNLTDCHLYRANFSRANLRKANIDVLSLQGAIFDGACLIEVQSIIRLLLPTGVKEEKQERASFVGCDLSSTDLRRCGLGLAENNWTNVRFRGCDLSGLDMSSSQLIGTDFTEANLCGTNLSSSSADKTTVFKNCKFDTATRLPNCCGQVMIIAGGDLTRAFCPRCQPKK